jgi:hypothetical protein
LRRRAETFLAGLANDETVGRRLFTLRLAHVPEVGEPVRRRARRSECSAAEWAMVEKLAEQDWRLLTLASAADGEPVVEVAHEQLLRRWPQLKSWLDEEREFLVWKGQVEHAAAAHAAVRKAERDEALLMGRPLAIARTWFERRADDLAPRTRGFVAASLAADAARRDTERWRQRVALFATSIGLILALALAALTGWQWTRAEAQRHEAESRRVVAEAQKHEADIQRAAAEGQSKETELQRAAAEAQTKEAQAQRERAEHSLALATKTANGLVFDLAHRFQNSGLPVEMIKDILNRALKLQGQLSAGGESSPELRRSQAMALLESVAVLLTIGDTQGALAAAQGAQKILEALIDSAPDRVDYQWDLSISHDRIGNALVAPPGGARRGSPPTGNRWRSAKSSPPPTPATPFGSATSRSATNGSANCWSPPGGARRRSPPTRNRWRSAKSLLPPIPAIPIGSAISRSAITRSAMY